MLTGDNQDAAMSISRTCLLVVLNSMMLLPNEREAASACYRVSPSGPVKLEESEAL